MTALVYLFGAYLVICYGWAIYLAIRLYTGKRLRQTLFGTHPVTEPTDKSEADSLQPVQTSPAHPTEKPAPHKVAA